MKLALYYAPTTCALVPYVTLTEAGADFEVRAMNFRKSENRSPEYLALNPLHNVPVLMIDGETLTENVAIQIWIARTFPQARLLPADPWLEIKAISFMIWCASGIHPHLSRIHSPTKYCGGAASLETVREIAGKAIFEAFRLVEARLAGKNYLFDAFTAPDAYFFWCFRRASQFGLELKDFPNCAAHFERMRQRPSVQKVLVFERQTLDAFASA